MRLLIVSIIPLMINFLLMACSSSILTTRETLTHTVALKSDGSFYPMHIREKDWEKDQNYYACANHIRGQIIIKGFGFYDGISPQTHGEFNNTEYGFWTHSFWLIPEKTDALTGAE